MESASVVEERDEDLSPSASESVSAYVCLNKKLQK